MSHAGGNHMPTELLEKPVEVDEDSLEVPKPAAQVRNEGIKSTPKKSLAGKIFENHQEFLGCTPD